MELVSQRVDSSQETLAAIPSRSENPARRLTSSIVQMIAERLVHFEIRMQQMAHRSDEAQASERYNNALWIVNAINACTRSPIHQPPVAQMIDAFTDFERELIDATPEQASRIATQLLRMEKELARVSSVAVRKAGV